MNCYRENKVGADEGDKGTAVSDIGDQSNATEAVHAISTMETSKVDLEEHKVGAQGAGEGEGEGEGEGDSPSPSEGDRGVQEENGQQNDNEEKERQDQDDEEDDDDVWDEDSEGNIPFEPFDINNDGRIIKTASQCSRESWKRPEIGWEVTISVHRFCELLPPKSATVEGKRDQENDNIDPNSDFPPSKLDVVSKIEPEALQLEFRLGDDEEQGFPPEAIDQAIAAGVKLHPLLHCGIETMGRSERASFVVTTDGAWCDVDGKGDGDDSTSANLPPRRRFEYDISLDDWTEEIDLSQRQDGSLVKRVIRDGDAVTRPVDVGGVTVRCRVVRMSKAPEPQGDSEGFTGETLLFDNLQNQEDDPTAGEGEGLEGPLRFVVDDCPFGPGVMTVLKSMTKGEESEAWLDPKHGPVDHADDGSFYHKVVLELVDVEELPPVFAGEKIRLDMSSRFKLEGNEKFAAGDFTRALRRYEKAIKYADGVPPGGGSDEDEGDMDGTPPSEMMQACGEEPESDSGRNGDDHAIKDAQQQEAFVDLQVAVLCNQAACFLKLGDGPSALEVAERATSLKAIAADSPPGIKAAYRRACALEAVGDWDEARQAFKSILRVAPKNSQCRQGIARLARAKMAYEAHLRKTFGGCLASGKLKGFASEGREVPESFQSRPVDGDETGGSGSWSEGSESETVSEDDDRDSDNSSRDEEEEEKEQKIERRVDALYDIATKGGSISGGELAQQTHDEENTASKNTVSVEPVDTTTVEPDDTTTVEPADATTIEPEDTTTDEEMKKETTAAEANPAAATAAALPMKAEAGTAPFSDPAIAEIVPLSSLLSLAKQYEVVEPHSKEAPQSNQAVKSLESQAAGADAAQDDPTVPLPSS